MPKGLVMDELEIDVESEEFKANPAAYVNKLHSEAVSGLKGKRDELLAKVAGGKATSAEKAELDSLREFKSQADIAAEETRGNYEKAQALKDEKHTAELAKAQEAALSAGKTVEKLLIDNGLSTALDGVKVMPEAKEAATALFRSRAKLDGESALIDGKPLSEAITEWAATDQGKFFIQAPNNQGGGAGGGDKGGGSGDVNPWAKDTFNLTQQAAILASDPTRAAQLQAAAK